MPAMAAFDTFLRSIREMPYIAPRAGISLQSMACRRRAEVLGSIVKGASFWDDDEGVVSPFSFSTFSRCAVCCSFSKVMFFAIMTTEIATRFGCVKKRKCSATWGRSVIHALRLSGSRCSHLATASLVHLPTSASSTSATIQDP
jgi:hypothetical protein